MKATGRQGVFIYFYVMLTQASLARQPVYKRQHNKPATKSYIDVADRQQHRHKQTQHYQGRNIRGDILPVTHQERSSNKQSSYSNSDHQHRSSFKITTSSKLHMSRSESDLMKPKSQLSTLYPTRNEWNRYETNNIFLLIRKNDRMHDRFSKHYETNRIRRDLDVSTNMIQTTKTSSETFINKTEDNNNKLRYMEFIKEAVINGTSAEATEKMEELYKMLQNLTSSKSSSSTLHDDELLRNIKSKLALLYEDQNKMRMFRASLLNEITLSHEQIQQKVNSFKAMTMDIVEKMKENVNLEMAIMRKKQRQLRIKLFTLEKRNSGEDGIKQICLYCNKLETNEKKLPDSEQKERSRKQRFMNANSEKTKQNVNKTKKYLMRHEKKFRRKVSYISKRHIHDTSHHLNKEDIVYVPSKGANSLEESQVKTAEVQNQHNNKLFKVNRLDDKAETVYENTSLNIGINNSASNDLITDKVNNAKQNFTKAAKTDREKDDEVIYMGRTQKTNFTNTTDNTIFNGNTIDQTPFDENITDLTSYVVNKTDQKEYDVNKTDQTAFDVNTNNKIAYSMNATNKTASAVNSKNQTAYDVVDTIHQATYDVNTTNYSTYDVNTTNYTIYDVNTTNYTTYDVNTTNYTTYNVNIKDQTAFEINTTHQTANKNVHDVASITNQTVYDVFNTTNQTDYDVNKSNQLHYDKNTSYTETYEIIETDSSLFKVINLTSHNSNIYNYSTSMTADNRLHSYNEQLKSENEEVITNRGNCKDDGDNKDSQSQDTHNVATEMFRHSLNVSDTELHTSTDASIIMTGNNKSSNTDTTDIMSRSYTSNDPYNDTAMSSRVSYNTYLNDTAFSRSVIDSYTNVSMTSNNTKQYNNSKYLDSIISKTISDIDRDSSSDIINANLFLPHNDVPYNETTTSDNIHTNYRNMTLSYNRSTTQLNTSFNNTFKINQKISILSHSDTESSILPLEEKVKTLEQKVIKLLSTNNNISRIKREDERRNANVLKLLAKQKTMTDTLKEELHKHRLETSSLRTNMSKHSQQSMTVYGELGNKTTKLEEDVKHQDTVLQHLHSQLAKTSILLAKLTSQVSNINMKEFIHQVRQSLTNVTQDIVTTSQWKSSLTLMDNSIHDNKYLVFC